MPTMICGARARRVALAVATACLAASLALPAFAFDTGGGGGEPAAAPAPAPHATMKPAAKPAAKLLDLDDARALIAKNDWDGAIKQLKVIVAQQPKNADALNLYGRALRQKGDMKLAEAWYLKALKLKPDHLGANEYLGELYVLTGQVKKAEARLATIGKVCGNKTCAEYTDLAKAIAAKA